MSSEIKDQVAILEKLKIKALNPMQEEAAIAIRESGEVVLLSPTGTGKTLAFLLPLLMEMDRSVDGVQAVIVVPSRELAIQIEQVVREMGSGFKANAMYGGQSFNKDLQNLKTPPSLLIATPGRLADHFSRETFSASTIHTIVLDEFDKSLEVGFGKEMKAIVGHLPNLRRKILTSATQAVETPLFVGLRDPVVIDYTTAGLDQLAIKTIVSPSTDKLSTLVKTLCHLGDQPGIIFCNFKDTVKDVSDYLSEHRIEHGCFFGGMEQQDRERALIKFRNGTHRLIVATDLASRGLDVPEIKFIIHYQLPPRSREFTHRNGRTARMKRNGTAYVLKWSREKLPDFIGEPEVQTLREAGPPSPSPWRTLFISGGRKDKISKGDIAGLFMKQGLLAKDELGVIELKQDCAFVAVNRTKARQLVSTLNNSKLKKRKIRVSMI